MNMWNLYAAAFLLMLGLRCATPKQPCTFTVCVEVDEGYACYSSPVECQSPPVVEKAGVRL